MRSPCTAESASVKSRPTVPIPSPAHFIWNLRCNSARPRTEYPPHTDLHPVKGSIMNRPAELILALVALSSIAFAADSKTVSYKSGDETVQGVLYTPSGKGPFPAIIVIHEWWGLNDWVKEQASKLAGEGYAALAIDLYRGKVAKTSDEAHEIMRGVPEDRAK